MQLLEFKLPRGGSFAIPTEWWDDAGMNASREPDGPAYSSASEGAQLVGLADIVPLSMNDRQHLPHLDYGGFGRTRMISVLRGIAVGADLPAIEVVSWHKQPPFAFRLCHGAHRFYASIAVGFPQVPTIKGWLSQTEYI